MAVRLCLVVVADDGILYSLHQTAANGSWSGWQSLGAPAGERLVNPALNSSLDGRLELFAFSTPDPGLWHRWQTARYGGWHNWVREPDPPGVTWTDCMAVVRPGQDGRLELFGVNGGEPSDPSNPAKYKRVASLANNAQRFLVGLVVTWPTHQLGSDVTFTCSQ